MTIAVRITIFRNSAPNFILAISEMDIKTRFYWPMKQRYCIYRVYMLLLIPIYPPITIMYKLGAHWFVFKDIQVNMPPQNVAHFATITNESLHI